MKNRYFLVMKTKTFLCMDATCNQPKNFHVKRDIELHLIFVDSKASLEFKKKSSRMCVPSLIQDFHCFLLSRYEVFTGRVLLAALDDNFHVFRKTLEGHFKKIYSKRSGNWRAEAVKEP